MELLKRGPACFRRSRQLGVLVLQRRLNLRCAAAPGLSPLKKGCSE